MFPDLLGLISAIYSYQPSEALKFWEHPTPEFNQFVILSMPPEHTPSPTWFCAFMEMLGALGRHESCAQHAFDFLLGTPNKAVNLNQVMMYMRDIRTKLSAVETPSFQAPVATGPLSDEVEDQMSAVLGYLQQLMKQSESIRVQIVRNKEWDVLRLLFGLFLCGRISSFLKAQILKTVSGFARSPQLAPLLWSWVENSQLLHTTDASGSDEHHSASIVTDFEAESTAHSYSLTIAFLKLLQVLAASSDTGLLSSVGRESRPGGFLPYLAFVRDSVFLRLDVLDFRYPGDRWHIASHCLRIFVGIVEAYDPQAEHSGDAPTDSSHGHQIMSRFLGHSNQMLRMVCWILQQLEAELPQQRYTMDGDKFELAALLSLQLLEVVLRQEDAFLLSLRARPVTELLTPVHQYLETEGPAIVTICKYILYADNAQLPLYSVRVVYLLSRKHANLVKILANSADAQRILVGFSEKLEAPEDAGNDDNDNDTGSWPDRYTPPENLFGDTTADDAEQRQPGDGELSVRRATNKSVKYAMIRLLLDNVAARGYNLAHFFLGFVDSVPFDMTDLSSPESLSCLSVIVDILDGLTPAYCATQPIFVESCYELVYRLCADQRTSTAVLRLLRRPSPGDQSTRYFFQRQLLLCAKAIERTCSPHRQAPLSVYQLNMWAWLLKSVALELHSSNFLDQRATSQTLVELLFLGTDSAERIDELARTIDDPHGDWAGGDLQTRILMLHLLDPVDYKFDDPPRLQGVRFGPFQSVDFDACRSVNAKGVQTIDIRHLYEHLLDQCDSIERGQPSRRKFQQLHQHIHDVLMAAVKQNVCWEAFSAKREYFEAWKQILGIALSRNCFRYLERFDSTWLFDFLETLLRKLERNDLLNPLAETASAAVLMLMYKLTELKQASSQPVARRPSVAQHQPHKRQPHQPHQQHQQSSSSFDAEYLPVDQLQKILRGILSSILRHGATQPLRCNLYGALLNYLKFTQHSPVSSFAVSAAAPAPADGDAPALQPHDVLRQAEQLETNQRMLDIGNRRIINSVGAKFLDALCSDVMDGSERTQTTAFATFDALMNYDSDHKWLDYIVRRGFLRSFIDRLQKTDERIQQLFATPDIRSFKYIAIFEAQLSFFLRVCQHAYGAGVLLRNGLVQKLTDCRFFDQWPGDSAYTAAGDSLAYASLLQSPNSTQQYYHQLLSPVLRLIVCLLSSMPSNKMAASEVCDFLKAHADFVSAVLQDRDPPTKDSLTLLELLSSVFMHLARHDELVQEKLQRKALTFQNLLLHLFAKYSSDRWHASDIHAAMRYLDIDHISAAGSSSASSAAAAASASSSTSSSSSAAASSSLAAASAAAAASKRSQNYDSASKIKEEVFIARDLCKNLVAYCRILTQLPPKATYSTAAGSDDDGDGDGDGDTYADGDDRAKTMRPVSMQLSWALFTPVIADESTELHAGPVHGKLPALAVLVQYLKATVAQLSTLKNDLQSLIDKFENCGQLSRNHLIELASYANDSGEPLDEMSALQHYAQIHLASSIAQTEQQIENADYAIENALWVLWRHLHFYLRQVPAAPIETPGLARPSPFFFGPREKQVLVREASAALDSTLSMIYKHQAQAPTKRSLVLQFVPRIRDLLRPSSRSR